MGNEQSQPIDPDTPPTTLKERSLRAVADLIKDGRVKRVVVMTGAGISTAAGIPDFRSPETGLYHDLARLNLPHAEAVFDIDYYRQNPWPFYELAKELYPGKFAPTISHVFIALLAKRKILRMLFTQNIDCLERVAGVPGSHIVEAHGSFATQRCIDCKTEFPDDEMKEHVRRGDPPRCKKSGCGGLVKPDIVFFGEQLPEVFYDNRSVPAAADLVLVLGTSLTVQPFASLPGMAMEHTPRVLFNKERVGDLGCRADDVLCLGDCDSGIRKLADELGWRDELETMWRKIILSGIWGEEEIERQLNSTKKREADMENEMARLVEGVEHKLELTAESDSEVANHADQEQVPETTEKGREEARPEKTEGGSEHSTSLLSDQDKDNHRRGSDARTEEAGSVGGDRTIEQPVLKQESPKNHKKGKHDSDEVLKQAEVSEADQEEKPVKPQIQPLMTTETFKGESVSKHKGREMLE